MVWVAVDRSIRMAERFGLSAPLARWRRLRETIRDDVLSNGYDAERNTFTQSYGRPYLDSALLMLPLVGFLPADDPRMIGTVDAVQRELMADSGLLIRYDPRAADDGLPGGEGSFLACTFWLAEAQALLGRADEATTTFERVLDLRNDLGLLAEEYDSAAGRQVGNYPQAFSHVPLISAATYLGRPPTDAVAAVARNRH
jgi:GH15 family glucan-1,4-alpha-glucosidase